METSIRRALANGPAEDPDFRVSVYEAADRAIGRVLEQDGDTAAADAKRTELVRAIEAIEADYGGLDGADRPASGTPAPPGDGADRAAAIDDTIAAPEPDPILTGPIPSDLVIEEDEEERMRRYQDWRPGGARFEAPRKRGKGAGFLLSALIVILILFLLGVAVWAILPAVFPQLSTPTASREPTIESAIARAENAGEWVSVFSGTQLDAITTDNGGRAVAETAPDGSPVVRITAPRDGEGAEIGFVVGQGVVDDLVGGMARAELTVGTDRENAREFSVRCLFGGDSACGRQRFMVNTGREAFVFDLDLDAADPEAGTIAVDPALGEGDDLIVYALRIRRQE